jgi:multicomponent Na+:H+ antiporter subunit E
MNGGPVLLSFVVWMLLTGDFSVSNAVLGFCAAVLIARLPRQRFSAMQLVGLFFSILACLPKAILEAFWIVIVPHRYEKTLSRKVKARNHWALLCQTLMITLTPRTLVVGEEGEDVLRVHRLERKEPV